MSQQFRETFTSMFRLSAGGGGGGGGGSPATAVVELTPVDINGRTSGSAACGRRCGSADEAKRRKTTGSEGRISGNADDNVRYMPVSNGSNNVDKNVEIDGQYPGDVEQPVDGAKNGGSEATIVATQVEDNLVNGQDQ